MVKQVPPPLFEVNTLLYPKGSFRCFRVERTPRDLIEDDVPMYLLRNMEYVHMTVKYPQDIIEREWSTETPSPQQQTNVKEIMVNEQEGVFAGPFLEREVIEHKASQRRYLVLATPDTCKAEGVASYRLKRLGDGPETPSFFRSSVDVEMHWKAVKVNNGEAYAYVKMEDIIDHLIRGDMLETRIFPETGPYYFLGVEDVGNPSNDIHLFRRIVNGVAENEVRRYTKRDLLRDFRVHTLQTASIRPTPAKYEPSWMIKHRKSGEVYTIALLPNKIVIESTREPAYGFIMSDGRICIRSQVEVEDPDRFERYIPPCNTVRS